MTYRIIQDSRSYYTDANVQEMKKFIQHGSISTYDHCKRVTEICLALNNKWRLNCDETLLVEICMLHDFYMYDWHEKGQGHNLHGFYHPRIAAENASRHFDIGAKSYRAILCHMWPLTLTRVPSSKEAWLLCLADKISAVTETFHA